MAQQHRPIVVGDVFHGFARGVFGRDHYDCVHVVQIGEDWIHVRDADNHLNMVSDPHDLMTLMEVRDEASCPYVDNGGHCPLDSRIQLTLGGFYARPS